MYTNALVLAALLFASAVFAEHHGDHGDHDSSMNSTDDDLYNPREALLKYITRRANPRVPPPPRYLPIQVQVKLRPLSLSSVCPKTYTVEMPTLEMYNWTDPRLAWNSSDFGGVEYLDMAAKDIWMPDIAVWQSPASTPMQTRPKEYKAVVTSDGAVLYIPISELTIHCNAAPWKRHAAKHSSASQPKSRVQKKSSNETEESGWGQDESNYKTYECEFDQGPWIYDISIVDVVPVTSGTPFAEHHEGNDTSSTDHSSEHEHEQQDDGSQEETDNQGNVVKSRQSDTEDFDSTADLSWFDGNELYDIESFTAERLVERYTSFPVDWASIHYHLVVKVSNANEKKWSKKSSKSKKISGVVGASARGSGSAGRRGAAAARQAQKDQNEDTDTDNDNDKNNEEHDD